MPSPAITPDRIAQTLVRHGLRQTPVRRAVLTAVAGKGYALSGPEIEREIGPGTTDRITLYRTLKSFEQHGLLHRVPDDTDVLRYAACSVECSAEAHFDNHVHFRCGTCAHTYCLSQVAVPVVVLPGGFQAERRDYLLSGTCQMCQPAS